MGVARRRIREMSCYTSGSGFRFGDLRVARKERMDYGVFPGEQRARSCLCDEVCGETGRGSGRGLVSGQGSGVGMRTRECNAGM